MELYTNSIDGTVIRKRALKNPLVSKRNSTDEYTRISSNHKYGEKNMTSSEIRLEKSESSIITSGKR